MLNEVAGDTSARRGHARNEGSVIEVEEHPLERMATSVHVDETLVSGSIIGEELAARTSKAGIHW